MSREMPLLLVVEDNRTQQKVIQTLAEKFGYSVVLVSTGEEAITALRTCDTCFDAILMDWKMPDMDGIKCTSLIREFEKGTGAHVPIIAVTARALDGDMQKCLEAGMDDYLSKPFSSEDFRRILLKWTYDPSRPNLMILPPRANDVGSSTN
jgi:two-component system, sensor histidine kinase and response regulator